MQTAEKLTITLPPEMVRIIREKVGTGAYSSNNEVIREALRDRMEREQRLIRRLPEALRRRGRTNTRNRDGTPGITDAA